MEKIINFYSPGTFTSEIKSIKIKGKNLNEIIKKSILESTKIIQRYNAKPYMFKIENDSKCYYLPHNKVELLSEIKRKNDKKNSILIRNMETNHWNAVVTTIKGWKISQPFYENDCLLNDNGEIILRGYEADIMIVREKKLKKILNYENYREKN